MSTINFTQLSAPFTLDDIEFRAGATNQAKTSALALAYITSRAVMNRLDEVVGPTNWKDEYRPGPNGGVLCRLSLRIDGEWIAEEDAAENTAFEAVKGGISDSFKRAAVKWQIGRYLYSTPDFWVSCRARGKTIILDQNEARTKFSQAMTGAVPQGKPTPPSTPRGNGAAPASSPSKNRNGKSKTNGNGKPAVDPMTAFWMAARERGLSREQGQEVLAAAEGDPVKALAALQRTAERSA